jgi:two-component system, OmpR family, phosphate regulon sensor histidine kinase PhoR
MKNSTITKVVLLGVIAIIGIIAIQSYWVVSTWNLNEEEFNKKVNLALYNVAGSLADLNGSTLPARNIVNKRTSNYYVVNMEDEIDPNGLEYFLQKEFEALALNVDFEYAVFDCITDEMVYGNYVSYNPGKDPKVELGDLPKYDEFTYYFGVKFPTRPGYLLGKMQLSIFFSVALLLTVLFFGIALFVILRQSRLSEMQKDFINNMTHEFKTPISTIRISADVFLDNPQVREDKRLYQYANIIREQNQRLNNQVEKVLQLARIEQNKFELKKERVNLREVLRETLDGVALQVEKAGGRMHCDMPGEEIFIEADRLHLTNILHNLLDNAVKYCSHKPLIRVAVGEEGKFIRFSISDNGIGISKEFQGRVFDKFYRIPTGNVHNVKGFGLGLYYVKKICDAHCWKLHLDSEEGKGTTLSVVFPRK